MVVGGGGGIGGGMRGRGRGPPGLVRAITLDFPHWGAPVSGARRPHCLAPHFWVIF